jgi:hypothetical protein
MQSQRIDKIDLQSCPSHHAPSMHSPSATRISLSTAIARTQYPHDQYVYNVQPTLWKRDSLLRALERYKDQTYRSIELSPIQQFCSENLNSYRTISFDPIEMGYYKSIREFVFLHLTHFHDLLPIDAYTNKMCKDGNKFYHREVVPRMIKSGRKFRTSMY